MKWKYLIFACTLTGIALLKAGAPPVAVASGLILAMALNYMQHRKGTVVLKNTREKNANNSAA